MYHAFQVITLFIRTFIAPSILGPWSRLQGLHRARPSDAPSFNVHRNDSDLCDPLNCHAWWTFTPTAIAFIRGLEDALSTSILFTHGKFLATYQRAQLLRDGYGLHWQS